MGCSLYVRARADAGSKEFNRHYGAVVYCAENNLSYPAETIEFFKGSFDGGSITDYKPSYAVEHLSEGVHLPVVVNDVNECETRIKVKDIPEGAVKLVVTWE